jgi:hypothetical protein
VQPRRSTVGCSVLFAQPRLFLRLQRRLLGAFGLFARFFAFFLRPGLVFCDFFQFRFVVFLFELRYQAADQALTGLRGHDRAIFTADQSGEGHRDQDDHHQSTERVASLGHGSDFGVIGRRL